MAPRKLVLASATLAAIVFSAGCTSPGSTGPQSDSPRSAATGSTGSTASKAPESAGAAFPAGTPGPDGAPFTVAEVATLDAPWAMAFLPDGRALVTLKGGTLLLVDPASGAAQEVAGVPGVADAGQGGLGDVIVGPTFATDRRIYLSWAEEAEGGTRAVVARATLPADGQPRLEGLTPLWRQDPSSGNAHYSHRMAIAPDGRHLFISSGERQKMEPAQDLGTDLGKILRLDLSGQPPADNPFASRGGAAARVWSLGHRNPLGLAFDADGRLWSSEMGPQGGDEVNLVERGGNYGWPRASNGSHYDGRDIPDHAAGDGFVAPKASWNPSISPSSLMIYSGAAFPAWRGDAFVGALSGQALIRLDLDGTTATAADRWDLGERIREVEQGPDGAIWLLEDGSSGRLLRLAPTG